MDVPYSNLVNQRKVFERRFAELERRKRETDAHSRFKDLYDAEQGQQDFRPQTTESSTEPRTAGRARAEEIRTTRARDINDPTDEGRTVYEEPKPTTKKRKKVMRGGNPLDDAIRRPPRLSDDEGGGAGIDEGEL